MKIRLVAPRMSLRPMDSEFKRRMTPSISLLVLAALTPEEHRVDIDDENISPVEIDGAADLVGITCNVDTFERARGIAQRYRTIGIPVVLGGLFPSACPERALECSDAVCIGEAEHLWETIVRDAGRKRLKRIYRWDGPHHLDRVPRPKWEGVRQREYLYTNVVSTSRGCPHGCDFCYNSCEYTVKRFRRRPIPNVLDEIRRLPTKHVFFIDDNFIGDVKWAFEFMDAIGPLGLTWHAAVSADIGDRPALLDRMAGAGCRSLYVGFESINETSISLAGKRQNAVGRYGETIAEIHRRSMMVNASMVFGFDGDGPEVFDDTLRWLVENRVETMTAHILTPYPGTRLYRRLEAEGRIIDRDLKHYNTAHVVFRPKRMSPQRLRDGYLDIYKRFYSLENIFKRRPLSRSQWYPYFLFNLGYRKFGKLFSGMARLGMMASFGRMGRRLSYGIG